MELLPHSPGDELLEADSQSWIERYMMYPVCSETSVLAIYGVFCLLMMAFSIGMELYIDWGMLDEIQVFLMPPVIYVALSYSSRLFLYLIPMALFTAVFNMWFTINSPQENIQLAIASGILLYLTCELIFRAAQSQRRLQVQKEALAQRLQESLDTIKRLSEILPICKVCDELRTDENAWKEFEQFLNTDLNVEIVKGICPSCVKKMVDEIQVDEENLSA